MKSIGEKLPQGFVVYKLCLYWTHWCSYRLDNSKTNIQHNFGIVTGVS